MASPDSQSSNNLSTVESTPLEGNELHQAIMRQVEFYFSTQNLPSDSYLLSQMDSEHFVAVSLIASFGKIKDLTLELDVLIESLKLSSTLELSDDQSKLRRKEERRRNRLILHNLPAETTDQELCELFASSGFTPEIKSDVNYCWFVSFDSEEKAAAALEFIRTQKIHDKSIRARLKPEPLLRNIYTPVDTSPSPAQYIQNPSSYTVGYQVWAPIMYYDQNGEPLTAYDNKDRRYKGKGQRNKDYRGKSYDSNKKRNTGQRKGKGRENKKQPPVQLGPSDFPPLPSTSGKNSGYSKEFKQYKQDEITETLGKLEAKKPEGADDFPFTAEKNTKLETSTELTIESKDIPASSKPVPMSERVKKPKASTPKSAKKTSDSPVKTQNDATDASESKGSWSQIAKGNPQEKTPVKESK